LNFRVEILFSGLILGVGGGVLYFLYPTIIFSDDSYGLTVLLIILLMVVEIALIMILLNFEYIIEMVVGKILLFLRMKELNKSH
jgi:hypothetical protein